MKIKKFESFVNENFDNFKSEISEKMEQEFKKLYLEIQERYPE